MPEKWKSLLQKYKYILLVLAVGILLMMLPTGQEEKDSAQLQQQWQEFWQQGCSADVEKKKYWTEQQSLRQ